VAPTGKFVKLLISGACGFVGSTLISTWVEAGARHTLTGIDNLTRPGSETNRLRLRRLGVNLIHGDLRSASDVESLPDVDAVVDAAANPSVLAAADGRTTSRQLVEHNLLGTLNLLELCRRSSATFILLSTSRVYSIPPLATLPIRVVNEAFELDPTRTWPPHVGPEGVTEEFSTAPPISLYGVTKLASEHLALEYGSAFGFPVWINRCGVLAGAGQFGRPDQGIFSYWINSWLRAAPLKYIGFDGGGHQVRDCLHPADLVPFIERQLAESGSLHPRVVNVSGGRESATSLRQLSRWCEERMGPRAVSVDTRSRSYDIPWIVLDSGRATAAWAWSPQRSTDSILEEILEHARCHPDWLETCADR
jgi:CDP-paratose 2-epimerase